MTTLTLKMLFPYYLTPMNSEQTGTALRALGSGIIISHFSVLGVLSDIKPKCQARDDLESSGILEGEIAFIKQLREWLGERCKWNLCYRASQDGWNAQDFHRCCDNIGPTVLLIKANNCIFGGYTDKNWGGKLALLYC